MEIWLEIPGFEGLYEVSNYGNVRTISGKHLTQYVTVKGYKTASLTKNKKTKSFFVHRLVAITFISNPGNKPEVNHIDSDRANNKVGNLEWVTRSENIIHSVRAGGTKPPNAGKFNEDNHLSKRVAQYDLSGNLVKIWPSMSEAERNGYIKTCISRCCLGSSRIHKRSKWAFYE